MRATLGLLLDMANAATKRLKMRYGLWYYYRKVPLRYRHIDSRTFVKVALKTDSLKEAQRKRDMLSLADDAHWAAMAAEANDNEGTSKETLAVQKYHYQAARERAQSLGYEYKTADQLLSEGNVEDVLARIKLLQGQFSIADGEVPPVRESNALLGGIEAPKSNYLSVSKCFDLFVDEIEFDAQLKKSKAQRRSWENAHRIAVKYFIELIGDVTMDGITREHARSYRNWWGNRIKHGDEDGKRPTPYTANRRMGSMKTIYQKYFDYLGQFDRANPFTKLSFKDTKQNKRPPFSVSWMRQKIINSDALVNLNEEARCIFYALIETGARPSEICNLRPENIHLKGTVPFIEIREQTNREVKASASNRDIPLLGISLEAMKAYPNGFPRYFDKDTLLSNTLMKYFRENDLLETEKHKIYSVRHSFEDRMLEAGIDNDLRCILMGHKLSRPAYGSGGSIEYRRDELLKIVHPMPDHKLI